MPYSPLEILHFDLDLEQTLYNLYQLAFAFILTLPIALNRESRAHGAGLRTFPLVTTAACGFMLVALGSFPDEPEAQARVLYGIVTGIGFIGGGAIIKGKQHVGGTATAAGIWNTGAIGVSVAYSHYEIAILLSFMNFCIFQFATPFKKRNPDLIDT